MSKKRIFISYARSDGEAYGKELRKKLVAEFNEGDIWRDRDELEGGVSWWQQIEEALESVEFMVLVATPKAMASTVVRKEWRKARQEGVCVYPVKVPELPIDFASLPRWMGDSHFYTLEEEWENFIAHLRAPCQAVRVPFFGVPDMPEHFVERPTEFDALVSQLLDKERDNPVAITTSLTGAGGFGKTTLATALCHDENVQTAFDDGVLWVTLGENPNVVGELTKIYRALTDENPGFVDANEGANMLAEKLVERDVLMVVDDVWNPAHLRPFLKGGERCARLITTRNINIALGANASTNEVDEMTPEQAVKMLLAGLEPPDDIASYEKLAKRLGEWALMLEIANGMLRQRIALGNSLEQAQAWVEKSLIRRGVDGIKRDDEEQRKRSAVDVLSASFELLNENEAKRLYQLAVFRDDSDIPLTSIMACWGLDDFDTEEHLQKFALYSFIRLDLQRNTIRIHDVIREILEGKLSDITELTTAHVQLIDNYGNLSTLHDDYAWRNIAYHLLQADKRDTLRDLLFNIDFLQAKLNATESHTLIVDYDTFKDDEGISLVQSGLKFISHKLIKKPSVLPSELMKCLTGYKKRHHEIEILFNSGHTAQLLPLHQTFPVAGGNLGRLEGHSDAVTSVTIQGDTAISASEDNNLIVWKWKTGEQVRQLEGHSDVVNSVVLSGDYALSVSSDWTVIVWKWKTGEQVRRLEGHSNAVNSVAIEGEYAISASGLPFKGGDNSLIVWKWKTGEQVRRLEGHSDAVNSVVLSGDYALSVSSDWTVIVWKWKTGEQVRRLEGHSGSVNNVTIQGEYAISASYDKSLIVWKWKTGEQVRRLDGHSHNVSSVVIEEEYAISASYDKSLVVWKWKTGEQVRRLEGHSGSVNNVTIQGEYAISASDDKSLIVWKWQAGDLVPRLKGHSSRVNSVAIEGEYAISASYDKSLIVWKWETGEQVRRLKGYSSGVNSVAIEGEYAISTSSERNLIIWNWQTGKQVRVLLGHSSYVTSVAIEDEYAISTSWDRSLIVWNWKTGEQVHRLDGHSHEVSSVVIEGEYAISASSDKSLIVWNWKTGEQVRRLEGHSNYVTSVTIQGEYAISASYDKSLIVWKWKTGEQVRTLQGHSGSVNNVAIAGDFAISASDDKTLMVWNWQTGERMMIFNCDSRQNTVAIGNGVIVSGGDDGQVHFFRPNPKLRELMSWKDEPDGFITKLRKLLGW